MWLHTRYEGKKKKEILMYSWLPFGTYHKNMAIWKPFFPQSLKNLGHFFNEKSFV
jgi:hypothetical protein